MIKRLMPSFLFVSIGVHPWFIVESTDQKNGYGVNKVVDE